MDNPTLTAEDIRHLSERLAARLADPEDEGGPEDVMTSIGYVGLWKDGDITVNGRFLPSYEWSE